jgi:hypothetical protein
MIFICKQLSSDTLNISVFNKHITGILLFKHYPIKTPVFIYNTNILINTLVINLIFAYGYGIIFAKVLLAPS